MRDRRTPPNTALWGCLCHPGSDCWGVVLQHMDFYQHVIPSLAFIRGYPAARPKYAAAHCFEPSGLDVTIEASL